jgi:hypothetical protein
VLIGWFPAITVTFVFFCAQPGPGAAASDDLNEFLARTGKPIVTESVSQIEPDDFTPKSVGSVCSEREGIRICQVPKSGAVVSFTLINSGSPTIVPQDQGVDRSYRLRFESQTLRNAKMMISEKSRPAGKTSHIFMRTSLYFFPRKVLPTLSLIENEAGRGVLELRLPTGERVCFDRKTKEILGGVLREDGPMDTNPDRFSRRFARVSYTGRGVMIRVDQRGESPEKAEVWGVRKSAIVSFAKNTCKISPTLLWEQESGWFRFRLPTDVAFSRVLRIACGWRAFKFPTDLADDASVCRKLP